MIKAFFQYDEFLSEGISLKRDACVSLLDWRAVLSFFLLHVTKSDVEQFHNDGESKSDIAV
jgi:hypothetical protein